MSSFSYEGSAQIHELINIFLELGTGVELQQVNKKALKECADNTKETASSLAPVSSDHNKSGRWNKGGKFRSVPPKHMADAIPEKIKTNLAIVGWDKGDISPYFYAKFEEYGTSEHPPHPFLEPALEQNESSFDEIFQSYYQKYINNKLGDFIE